MILQKSLNDLDPKDLSELEEKGLKFYSIWDFNKRDHLGLSPLQIKGSCPIGIPLQCILRFSKEKQIVLDPFCGSGSTLIASAYLKREGVGIEINTKIAQIAKKNLSASNSEKISEDWLSLQRIIIGDSIVLMNNYLKDNSFDLIFAHPPYWNLIKYSEHYSKAVGDLSSEKTLQDFLDKVDLMFQGFNRVLKSGKFVCVLIGDVFLSFKHVIPLDYYFTKIALNNGFDFYSKVIKVTRNATSRKNRTFELKKRSLKSNFFICIHDYLLIFNKKK